MNLELISFKLCPYVQRAVITLIYRAVPYRITYIDLDDPPGWFEAISPFGKVPVLKVDDDTVLFESAVITEFIDEVTPGNMQPATPLARAVNRAWVEFGSACLGDAYALITAGDAVGLEAARAALHDKLGRLEAVVAGPFFNGAELALIDTSYAPLFMRLELLAEAVEVYTPEELPRVAAWSDAVLALPAVRESVVPEFPELFREAVRGHGGHLAARLG